MGSSFYPKKTLYRMKNLNMELRISAAYLSILCVFSHIATIADCAYRPSQKCIVDDIRVQEDFDIEPFTGYWYDVARLEPRRHRTDLDSAVSHVSVDNDGVLQLRGGGSRGGSCIQPLHAEGYPLEQKAKYHVMHDGSRGGSMWVIETDYHNYALLYGCNKVRPDGTCNKNHESVYIKSRSRDIDPRLQPRLDYFIQYYLCIDPASLTQVQHLYDCPPSPTNDWRESMMIADEAGMSALDVEVEVHAVAEQPAQDFAECKPDISPVSGLSINQWLGRWYLIASNYRDSNVVSSPTLYIRLGSDGNIESYKRAAKNGRCMPTFYVDLELIGDGTMRRLHIEDKEPWLITYLSEGGNHAVFYRCGKRDSEGECIEPQIDVTSRTKSMEETVRSAVKEAITAMCQDATLFDLFTFDVDCEVDLGESERSCLVSQVKVAHDVRWNEMDGEWYTLFTLNGNSPPSLSWYNEIAVPRVTSWLTFSRDDDCEAPRSMDMTIDSNTRGLMSLSNEVSKSGRIVYHGDDVMLFYQCSRLLEDGTCDPGHKHLDITFRSRDHAELYNLLYFKVLLHNLCIDIKEMEPVLHEVKCSADPTRESALITEAPPAPEETMAQRFAVPECRFINLQGMSPFNIDKFMGTWYHMYRLKWSQHEFEAEKNLLEKTSDSTIISYAAHFSEGRCSGTKVTTYTPTKSGATLHFGTYGGAKILYADDLFAIVYLCERVEFDGSCKPENIEVEALARFTDRRPPQEVTNRIISVLDSACLRMGDFEQLDHSIECELSKVQCDADELSVQQDFNMERYTGTWHTVIAFKDVERINAGKLRITKTDDGYRRQDSYYWDGECKSMDTYWHINEKTKIIWQDNHKAFSKVLYTDYQNAALVYLCNTLMADGKTCAPHEATVYGLSRTRTLSDSQIRTMIKATSESCFHLDDFQWLQVNNECEFDKRICLIQDMPKATNFDISTFLFRWYGMFIKAVGIAIDNGVVQYELEDNGALRVHATGSRGGKCLGTTSYVALPGDTPYEWNIHIGAINGYVRILDASDRGDDHAVIYECDLVLGDGSCDPSRQHVTILTRRREDMSEDIRSHLREVLREACIDSGDFVPVTHDMNCPIQLYEDYACNYWNLPAQQNLDHQKFSGTWHAIARLNGTSVPDSGHLRYEFHDDDTVTIYSTGYSARRGCHPTSKQEATVRSSAEFLSADERMVHKVVWTNYDIALVYACLNLNEDGTCPPGLGLGYVLSRDHVHLNEEQRSMIAGVSNMPCMRTEDNYQWTSFAAHCELDIHPDSDCRADQFVPAPGYNHDQIAGKWYLLRFLRRDSELESSTISLEPVDADTYRIHYAIHARGDCYTYFRYAEETETSGVMRMTTGRIINEAIIVYQSADYVIYLFCPVIDGHCNPERVDLNLYGITQAEPSDEMIQTYNEFLAKLCLVPGDAIMPTQALDSPCSMPQAPAVISCAISEVPIKKNLNPVKMTGTWYLVVAMRGSMISANSMLRLQQSTEEDHMFDVSYTSLAPNGSCGATKEAHMHLEEDGSFSVHYPNENGTMRVLYSDGAYALVYDCWRMKSDGTCDLAADSIYVLSRTKTFHDDAIPRMVHSLEESGCLSRYDFALVEHPMDCHIAHEEEHKCKVRNIPAQDNFDVYDFVGTWYGHYKLYTEWKSVVYVFQVVEGKFMVYVSGENDGDCQKPLKFVLRAASWDRASFTAQIGDNLHELKIVYTDYRYAVVYNCDKVMSDGQCARDSLYVDVVSRDKDPIPDDVRSRLIQAVQETCFEPGDLMHTPHIVNCDPLKTLDCSVRDFPIQKKIDMERMTGEWKVLMYARHTMSQDQHSLNMFVKRLNFRVYQTFMSYSQDGKCIEKSYRAYGGRYSGDSRLLAEDDGYFKGFRRVIYMSPDYEVGLIYACLSMPRGANLMAGDKCDPGKERLNLISRRDHVNNSQVRDILEKVKLDCLSEDDLAWANREDECYHKESHGKCVVNEIETAKNFDINNFLGTWYARHVLRDRLQFNSIQMHFEKLMDGNIKGYMTGSRNGECLGSTLSSIARTSEDNPAVLFPRGTGSSLDSQSSRAIIKITYLDKYYAILYECDDIQADGICEPHHVHIAILSRSKDTLFSSFTREQLLKKATAACVQIGQFVEVPQTEDCYISQGPGVTCSMDELPDIPNFNFDKSTGTTYTVMRLRGSAWPDSSTGYLAKNDGGTYDLHARWSRFGDCMPTAHGHIEVSLNKPEWYMEVDGSIAVKSRTLWTDGYYNLVVECHRVLFDGSCVPGYEVVLLFSHDTNQPPQDVLEKIREVSESSQCFIYSHMEPVNHEVTCKPEIYEPDSCKFENIPVHANFDPTRIQGVWYMLWRLRGTGDLEWAKVNVTSITDMYTRAQYSFKVNGECHLMEGIYEVDRNEPGVLHEVGGPFKTTIKMVFADEDYQHIVVYECDKINQETGMCEDNNKFVAFGGRTTDKPSDELIERVKNVMRDYCIQPGDMDPRIFDEDECTFESNRAEVKCSTDVLPMQENHVRNKDTGVWYLVAKLRGSFYLDNLEYRILNDEETHMNHIFAAGERARGGCTDTARMAVPDVALGENSAIRIIQKANRTAMLKILYNDYRYFMLYECAHLQEDNTCYEGMDRIAVMSRKPEHIPENMIQKIFANIPEECFTRKDFEWVEQEGKCEVDAGYRDCHVRSVHAVENFDLDNIVGTWYSRYNHGTTSDWSTYAVRFEKLEDGTMMGFFTPTRNGKCLRAVKRHLVVPKGTRGLWYRDTRNYTSVTKVMWMDSTHAVVYSCLDVMENDMCAPGMEYLSVISRDMKPLSVAVVERIKEIIDHSCFEPGDLVESNHNMTCEEKECAVHDVTTDTEFSVDQLYGTWELKARTSHLNIQRGPTTMRFMKGAKGAVRMKMARNIESGCQMLTSKFTPQSGDSATLHFTLEGHRGLLKVMQMSGDMLLTYECFDAEAIEGYCPEDHEEVQLWSKSREPITDDVRQHVMELVKSNTCVDLSQAVSVPANVECSLDESCKFDDLVAQHEYDPQELLGVWYLIAMSVPEVPEGGTEYYSSLSMQYIYQGYNDIAVALNGQRRNSEGCSPAKGQLREVDGKAADFLYEFADSQSITKALHVCNMHNLFLEMECRGGQSLDGAKCSPEETSFYVWARSFDNLDEKIEMARTEIEQRTHGCYNLSNLEAASTNTDCPVEQTCKLEDFVTMDYFEPRDMLGTWKLQAKQGPGDYTSYDIKIEYLDDNEFRYTMNGEVDSGECMRDEGLVMHDPTHPGLYHYAYQGTETLAKMLYKGADMYIDMECKANFADGSCSQDDVTFFIQARYHNDSEQLLDFAREEIVKRTHGCFDVSRLTRRAETDCEFVGTCRFEDMQTLTPDFDPRDLIGTWHMIGHDTPRDMNVYRTFEVKFLYVHDNMLELTMNGVLKDSSGECYPDRGSVTFQSDQPGVYEYSYHGKTTHSKALYIDDNYYIEMECKSAFERGVCPMTHVGFYAYSRTYNTSEELKEKAIGKIVEATLGCYDMSRFHFVDENLACDMPAVCRMSDMATSDGFNRTSLLGSWQLLGRSVTDSIKHFRSYTIKYGYITEEHYDYVLAGKRGLSGHCESERGEVHHLTSVQNSYRYTYGNHDTFAKNLYMDGELMLEMECKSKLVDGACPREHAAFYAYGRKHQSSAALRARVMNMITERTHGCFAVDVFTSEKNYCDVPKTCFLDDFVTKETYHTRKMLGTWHLVAKQLPDSLAFFHSFRIKYSYVSPQHYTFKQIGELGETSVCGEEIGEVIHNVGRPGVYKYIYQGIETYAATIFVNDDWLIEVECRTDFVQGHCPEDQTGFYVYGRKHKMSQELKDFFRGKINKRTNGCFSLKHLVFTDKTECDMEDSCAMKDLTTIQDYDMSAMLGTWELIAKATPNSPELYREFTIQYYYVGHDMLKFKMNGKLRDGSECSPDEGSMYFSSEERGSYIYEYKGQRSNTKALYLDDNYYAELECRSALSHGVCPPGQAAIYIYGKKHEHNETMKHKIVDKLVANTHGCYDLTNFQFTAKNTGCQLSDTCSLDDFVTMDDFDTHQLIGTWQLSAALFAETPNFYRAYTIRYGHVSREEMEYTIAGTMGYEDCSNGQADIEFVDKKRGVYKYSYRGGHTTAKTLHVEDNMFIEIECNSNFQDGGHCAPDDVSFYVNTREHVTSPQLLEKARMEINKHTHNCFDLSELHLVNKTTCKLENPCYFIDFAHEAMKDFDPRYMLGTWETVGITVPKETRFKQGFTFRLGYLSRNRVHHTLAGNINNEDECSLDPGEAEYFPRHPGLYSYHYADEYTLAKALYREDDYMIEMECFTELQNGRCPRDQTAFYAYSREYENTNALRVKFIKEIARKTEGCYDVSQYQVAAENECETPEARGRSTCAVNVPAQMPDFEPSLLEGLWYVIAYSITLEDFDWDSGIHYNSVDEEGNVHVYYTGYGSYDSTECLPVEEMEMQAIADHAGYFNSSDTTEDKPSLSKILHVDENLLIYYECVGKNIDEFGLCDRSSEYLEVSARRRGLNSREKSRATEIIKSRTCIDIDRMVQVNQSRLCDIPGITDKRAHPKSCRAEDYQVQQNLDLNRFSGEWYELERTRFAGKDEFEDSVVNMTVIRNDSLIYEFHARKKYKCHVPFTGYTVPTWNQLADMEMHVGSVEDEGSPYQFSFQMKVVHTDYDHVAVLYACAAWNDNGICRRPGEQVSILSRTPSLSDDEYTQVYDVIESRICVDRNDFVRADMNMPCDHCADRPVCRMYCAGGFKKGPDGCDICECATDPCARKAMCLMACPHGFVQDENGCDTCECKEDPCSGRPLCAMFCEHGMAKDENGCSMCECNEDPCAGKAMCMMACPHGFVQDEKGCDTCECKEDPCAGRPLCAMYCEHGMAKDENGCSMCECNEDPCAGRPMCMMACPHGFVQDENGCDTCECKEDPCVGRPVCTMYCERGFVKDENGCSMCKCKEDPCAGKPMCMMACPHGVVQDENGCDTCECKEDPCAGKPMCMMYCEHDFVQDENGCDLCECKEDPCAGRPMCRMYCEHGFVQDENGCDLCECREDPCAGQPMCMMYCEHGFVQAENGCDICECKEDPCAGKPKCMMYCEHGFVQDENGCDMCECKEDPCAGKPMCMMYCEHGFVQDENACDMCECKEDPCAGKPMCMLYCANGYATDENGCDLCQCVEETTKESMDEVTMETEDESLTFAYDEDTTEEAGMVENIAKAPFNCAVPMCAIPPCENGLATDENGCEICECAGPAGVDPNEVDADETENDVDPNAVNSKGVGSIWDYFRSLV